MINLPFHDRTDAGRQLAHALQNYAHRDDVLVLALPRGGLPVAVEVATALAAPLDLLLVRKLGLPGQEELAMGAIASGGVRVLNEDLVRHLGIAMEVIEAVAAAEAKELRRREETYRGQRPPPEVRDRRVILIDDGLATGATMRAAVAALRRQQPAQIVVAVPVAPPQTVQALRSETEEVVCLATPEPFLGVGRWYASFPQLDDSEVRDLLARAWSA